MQNAELRPTLRVKANVSPPIQQSYIRDSIAVSADFLSLFASQKYNFSKERINIAFLTEECGPRRVTEGVNRIDRHKQKNER